jgi:hypothetical protein
MVAYRESATLAARLIDEACSRQGISPGQLTIHADRGSSMTSKTVALLLADLGVTKTHSRPHVSDDNPYSESQFKTLKYRPDFPDRFGSLQHARNWNSPFFHWYNHEHRHGGIAYLTPADVHYGWAEQILRRRARRFSPRPHDSTPNASSTVPQDFRGSPRRSGSTNPSSCSKPKRGGIQGRAESRSLVLGPARALVLARRTPLPLFSPRTPLISLSPRHRPKIGR